MTLKERFDTVDFYKEKVRSAVTMGELRAISKEITSDARISSGDLDYLDGLVDDYSRQLPLD